MCTDVVLKVTFLHKAVVAKGAGVGPFSRVDPGVPGEVGRIQEGLPTGLARVHWLLVLSDLSECENVKPALNYIGY